MNSHSIIAAAMVVLMVASCGNNNSSNTNSSTSFDVQSQPAPVICQVLGSSSLYAEPKDGAEKLINKKSTELLGEVDYLSIDKSCKVKILEEQDGWVKIQVTEPDWLTSSHIGWVKRNIVAMPSEIKEDTSVYEENKDYQVMYEKTIGTMLNVHVLLLAKTTEEEKLESITKYIKKTKYGNVSCNINIYDSKDIVPLIEKYPIEGQDYVKLADHFLYCLNFDGSSMYYPYKDVQYKEYGGKNPIER